MSTAAPARYAALLGFLLITFAAAAIGSWATFQSVREWYPTLAKPAWTPPSAVFGPVWTILYVMMSVAAWRAWRTQTGSAARVLLGLYIAQLIANALWSVLFFGLRRPDHRVAVGLWIPYVAWVTFAVVLNAAIWRLNR